MRTLNITKPQILSDLVFNDTMTEKRVHQYATCRRAGNIIFYGPKGTGKSTTAQMIVQSVFSLHQNPNAVPIYHAKEIGDKQMNAIDNEWNFQMSWGIKFPYVIIDEIEQLSPERRRQLRAKMDGTDYGKLIFTTNKIYALDEPFLDRCDDIEMAPIDITQWRPKVFDWLKENGIQAENELVERMLATNTGTIRDLRRIIEDIACECH